MSEELKSTELNLNYKAQLLRLPSKWMPLLLSESVPANVRVLKLGEHKVATG